MNARTLQVLSLLPSLNAAHPLTLPPAPTVTLNELVQKASACSSGQSDLKTGYQRNVGQALGATTPLTPGLIERSAVNYGYHWVVGNYSTVRSDALLALLVAAQADVVEAVLTVTGDLNATVREALGAVRTWAASGNADVTGVTEVRTRLRSSVGQVRGNAQTGLNAIYQGLAWNLDDIHRFVYGALACNNLDESRVVTGAAYQLRNGEPYQVPALPVFSGARLKFGELIFEVTFDGARPTLTHVPYRSPAGGEQWQDAQGGKYLVLADGERVVNLASGDLIPLSVDLALPGTVRGVSFTFAPTTA